MSSIASILVGSGGPGHTSTSYCIPANGAAGGGAIQIAAKTIVNADGNFRAQGGQGYPRSPTCQWPNDNPQVG